MKKLQKIDILIGFIGLLVIASITYLVITVNDIQKGNKVKKQIALSDGFLIATIKKSEGDTLHVYVPAQKTEYSISLSPKTKYTISLSFPNRDDFPNREETKQIERVLSTTTTSRPTFTEGQDIIIGVDGLLSQANNRLVASLITSTITPLRSKTGIIKEESPTRMQISYFEKKSILDLSNTKVTKTYELTKNTQHVTSQLKSDSINKKTNVAITNENLYAIVYSHITNKKTGLPLADVVVYLRIPGQD
jgi:hypothetical protein